MGGTGCNEISGLIASVLLNTMCLGTLFASLGPFHKFWGKISTQKVKTNMWRVLVPAVPELLILTSKALSQVIDEVVILDMN